MSPLVVMLLVSLGPLLVGFTDIGESKDSDEADGDDVPVDTETDPVEIVDVAAFIDAARLADADIGALEISRGTDQDEEFVASADVSAVHDASGGEDTLTGSMLNDTLAGGEGADVIEGGDGDDALFGAFSRETRADDEAADTLDGGAGDDTLFMGDGDTGNGGDGSDVFVTTQDADDIVTITDFNVEEDAIAIETEAPDDASVTEQVVEEGGLRIELSTGLSLRLEGIDAPLPAGSVQFVPVAPLEET